MNDKLISELERLRIFLGRVMDAEGVKSIEEAMDIINDYQEIAAKSGETVEHFQMESRPVRKGDFWCCPACGKPINPHHDYCHWCGKKMGWSGRPPDRRLSRPREFDKTKGESKWGK